MGTCSVVLTFESVDKILWCEMKPLQQYFCMVPFVFQYLTTSFLFLILRNLRVKIILFEFVG